jgi:predicted P-loop ATPase
MPDGINLPPGITLAGLAQAERWVAWETKDRPGADKPTKTPINPATGGNGAADRPSTWGDRAAAEQRANQLSKPHGAGGVGIILGVHEGLALGGLDLDTCRDPETGKLAVWTEPFLELLPTYGEVSPSGTGIKLFFRYDPAALPELQQAMGTKTGKQWKQQGGDHPPGVEMYLLNRFFAVTDDAIGSDEISLIPTETLLYLIRELGPATFAKAKPSATSGLIEKTGPSDQSRSAKAMATAARVKGRNGSYEEFLVALDFYPDTSAWKAQKGIANGGRELRRTWDNCRAKPDVGWLPLCQTGQRGEPRGNLHNAMIALRHESSVSSLFRLDEMLRAPVIATPDGLRVVTDADVSRVQVHLQQCGLETLGKDTAHQAVDMRAEECAFHPVRDYLNALRWDGKQRVHKWLHSYLGAADDEYAKQVGTMFLVAMVARVMEPGCKVDYMMVLEGPQGARKSTVCAILGGPWFSDGMPDIDGGKDAAQHLNGKWLIEIAELAALGKAENSRLKSFITRPVERYRPSYGRKEVIEPRQCVFIGTTNQAEYLRDETGGRRFWPVEVGKIDTDALARDRDQLFAEAVQLYKQGVTWWPHSDFEAKYIRPQQEERFVADAWEEPIADWLADRPKVTVGGVLLEALGIDVAKHGKVEQSRVLAILKRLGWKMKRSNGVRWYSKGPGQ